ncbi:hypothetical protein Trydic_g10850 [Trypoxylus dichotomus]
MTPRTAKLLRITFAGTMRVRERSRTVGSRGGRGCGIGCSPSGPQIVTSSFANASWRTNLRPPRPPDAVAMLRVCMCDEETKGKQV